ncbi:hypothetical protein Ddc_19341 [Ditylenchus destructor]|nr:hypothetical protein Ddc_19341 [Ditylenchus destructor]
MAATHFNCYECQMGFNEYLDIKRHISAKHIKYFPYKCLTCKEIGVRYETISAELMYQHTSTVHLGIEPDVRFSTTEENELKIAIEKCRRSIAAEQVLENDSKDGVRRVFISLGTALADSGTNDTGNGVLSAEDEADILEVPERSNRDHIETTIEGEVRSPHADVSIQQNAEEQNGSGIRTSIENYHADITVSNPKIEPRSEVTDECQAAVGNPTTSVEPKRRGRKRRGESNSESNLQTKQLKRAKNPNRYAENVAECPEYQGSNGGQLAGPIVEPSAISGQCTYETNQSGANNSNTVEKDESQIIATDNDRFQSPTTSAQAALDVPGVQMMKISKIWINISSGNAHFETIGKKYQNRPLTEYMKTFLQSQADEAGCEAHFVFGFPYFEGDGPETVIAPRENFEKCSQQVRSISHLWANGHVVAEFYEYSERNNKVLPLSDICDGLFSQSPSILSCKQLEIRLSIGWPLSVITNVARHCDKLILKEMGQRDGSWRYCRNQMLHYIFLDALYEMKTIKPIDMTLEFVFHDSAKAFTSQLKKRFHSQNSTVQQLKFTLVSPGRIQNELLLNKNGTGILETKTVASPWRGLNSAVIEQRSFTVVPDEQPTGIE